MTAACTCERYVFEKPECPQFRVVVPSECATITLEVTGTDLVPEETLAELLQFAFNKDLVFEVTGDDPRAVADVERHLADRGYELVTGDGSR